MATPCVGQHSGECCKGSGFGALVPRATASEAVEAESRCAQSTDILQFNRFFDMTAIDRKRPIGTPTRWEPGRRMVSGRLALASGYQLRRGLVPPLLSREVEPGEAIRILVGVPHPFADIGVVTNEEATCIQGLLESDDWISEKRRNVEFFWRQRAQD